MQRGNEPMNSPKKPIKATQSANTELSIKQLMVINKTYWKCPICKETFRYKFNFMHHMKEEHNIRKTT